MREAAIRQSRSHAPVIARKRVAHTLKNVSTSSLSSSSESNVQRPVILLKAGGKIPTNLRQKYLDCFVDECLKICTTEKEAYDKVQCTLRYLLYYVEDVQTTNVLFFAWLMHTQSL